MKIISQINSKAVFIFLLVLSILAWQNVFAISSYSIYMDKIPTNPKPGENVTITLSSYAANLDIVSISWFVNDKLVLSGVGEKSYSLNAGQSGTQTKVAAKLFLPDGDIEKTVFISPASMVLLWEAKDSYTPPFYKGKALPTAGSPIKVVAMPEIKSGSGYLNSKNISYSWKKDYDAEPTASGYGKNYYTYTGDILDSENTISVDALTVDQKSSSFAEVNIKGVQPEIVFYPRNNDFGTIWENAIPDNYSITGEAVIAASPYFLSPEDTDRPELMWKWSINNNMVLLDTYRKDIMPVQVTDGSSGTSKIELEIENTFKFLPAFSKEIYINF